MGDRTNGTFVLYSCPEEKRNDVLEILSNHGYSEGWSGHVLTELKDGFTYGAHEVYGNDPEEVTAEILALWDDRSEADGPHPDLCFEVYTDPAYEWLGSLALVTPLGVFKADCDAEGTPMFSAAEIKMALRGGTLDTLLGTKHYEVLASYVKKIGEVKQ